ncbi:MAG TPA: molybdopterin cofactor-binding domain-containing protein, partial [Dehalococcoidia bacterium]|nr:molybdopterin cofactor-binding domain-containing protein [Dehalococcoidia bacterium]
MIDQRGTEGWRTVRLSRRHLIRLSGMLGAGLAVACSRIPAAGPGAGQPTDVESPIANETPAGTPIALPRRSPPADVDAYLRIGPEGNVTLFTGKVEFGQGVQTGFAQLAAEELDVPLEHMNVVMGVTNQAPFDTGTFGSQSTRGTGPVIRQAAA